MDLNVDRRCATFRTCIMGKFNALLSMLDSVTIPVVGVWLGWNPVPSFAVLVSVSWD